MICSDAQLRRLYIAFNRRYWGAKLPAETRVLWLPVDAKSIAETVRSEDGNLEIHLSPAISGFRRFAKVILLHEMAHVALWDRKVADHGKIWEREMLRVLSAGAARYL